VVLVQVSQGCAALQIQGVHAALSTPNKSVIATCPTSEHLVAAAANSFAVIYDTSTPEAPVQKQQLRSTTSNQPLQCLAWSCCGTHLAAGETGSNAAVFVWDVNSGCCQQELKAHKTTVGELCFSPDGTCCGYVASESKATLSALCCVGYRRCQWLKLPVSDSWMLVFVVLAHRQTAGIHRLRQ
jgi:WD40 repeat protein